MSAEVPVVTILMITYNHEAFVERAVDSILMQDVGATFEIVIADDGSTDRTLEIIRSIAKANPSVPFRFLDATKNLGITRNYQRAFADARGIYTAVIEGDDYWVSPIKLRRQIEFLSLHRECDLCSVNYYVYEQGLCRFTPRVPPSDGCMIFGARELIADNIVGNFSTCLYRTHSLRRIPDAIYAIRSYDWAINICIAMGGMIGFIQTPMSVYRIHTGGAWSLLSHSEKVKAQLDLIPQYDSITGRVFSPEFSALAQRLEVHLSGMQSEIDSGESAQPSDAMSYVSPPPLSSRAMRFLDWVPPVALSLGRQLLPPAFKRQLVLLLKRF